MDSLDFTSYFFVALNTEFHIIHIKKITTSTIQIFFFFRYYYFLCNHNE